jgi:hypothetical protein
VYDNTGNERRVTGGETDMSDDATTPAMVSAMKLGALLVCLVLLAGCLGGGGGGTPAGDGAGDDGSGVETPDTGFEASQEDVHYCHSCKDGKNWSEATLTTVEISHTGGAALDIDRTAVAVNGNTSVYGSVAKPEEWNPHYPDSYAVPDFTQTRGTNKVVEFGSGDSWRLHSYGNGSNYDGLAHEHYRQAVEMDDETCNPALHFQASNPAGSTWNRDSCYSEDGGLWSTGHDNEPVKSGDEVTVHWEANSGGETATLFTYTVE